MSEKDQLLEEVSRVLDPKKGVDGNFLLYTLLLISLVMVLAFPKIYLNQQIYFISRDISKLKSEHDALREENRYIKRSIEALRYKNQIVDTIF
ncbi:MAG: hypothetical protein WCR69_06880 [Sulfuricurvum sp.]